MNTNQRLGRNADGTTGPGFHYVAPGGQSRPWDKAIRRAVTAITSAFSK